MNVVIPVFKDCVSGSVVGMMDLLVKSNVLQQQLGPERGRTFEVELMAVGESLTIDNNGFPITCHRRLSQNPPAGLVIVPASDGDLPLLLAQHAALIAWLQRQHAAGAVVCSTCTGAFFVAAAGLLDGQPATTSWFAVEAFRRLFPTVILHDERIIVDNGRVITGGATLSFQNLCVYLIERFYGKALSSYVAKLFLVEKGKSSQLTFAMFNGQKTHADTEILRIQEFIEKHATEKLVVTALSQQAAMAERTFIRRFKAATGNTPSEYIQRVKVESAKNRLEEDRESIKEIGYRTGYEDLNYFRDVFRKYTGLSPAEYRKQFSFRV